LELSACVHRGVIAANARERACLTERALTVHQGVGRLASVSIVNEPVLRSVLDAGSTVSGDALKQALRRTALEGGSQLANTWKRVDRTIWCTAHALVVAAP